MTPGPSLEEMIATVRADARSDDARDQLAAAASAVAELEEVADAVMAHFVDRCRRSGRSWSEISAALGVSKQAAHKRFAAPPLDRFTPRAKSALNAAAEAARSLGHDSVGTEHLLLGLFEPAGGIAARVLEETGISRAIVEEQITVAVPATSSTDAEPPYSPGALDAIRRAATEAVNLGHNYVGTEHVLLALFGDRNDLATTILANAGAQRDNFTKLILQKVPGYTKPQP